MYLVDTVVISEARSGSKEAAAWLRSIDPSTVYISTITIGELMRGIAKKRSIVPRRASDLEIWLKTFCVEQHDHILPITAAVAMEWGRIAAQRPRGDANGLIAATAIVHDLILVTRNVAEFEDTRASTLNPWDLR